MATFGEILQELGRVSSLAKTLHAETVRLDRGLKSMNLDAIELRDQALALADRLAPLSDSITDARLDEQEARVRELNELPRTTGYSSDVRAVLSSLRLKMVGMDIPIDGYQAFTRIILQRAVALIDEELRAWGGDVSAD